MFDVFVRIFKLFNSKSGFALLLIQREERKKYRTEKKGTSERKKGKKGNKGRQSKTYISL